MLGPVSFLASPSLAPCSISRCEFPLKLDLIGGDPDFSAVNSVRVEDAFGCSRTTPSLPFLTALHLADVFCERNVENFPFHHVRSSGLGLALPQEPSGHSWSREGPGWWLSWESWPSLGLKATVEQG